AGRDGDDAEADAVPAPAPFAERRLHGLELRPRPRIHGHERLARTDRGGGEHDAVEDKVRVAPEQQLVLAARRLALDAVRDDDGLATRLGDRPQLAPDRKGRAA